MNTWPEYENHPRCTRTKFNLALACLAIFAATQWFARPATAQSVPNYITAKPGELQQAYGTTLANTVFSDQLTKQRIAAVTRSAKGSPLATCASEPEIELVDIYPAKIPSQRAWIEKYRVVCGTTLVRSLFGVEKNSGIELFKMVPGRTLADALLQVDAERLALQTIAARHAKNCQKLSVVESEVNEKPKAGKWKEVWAIAGCNHVYRALILFLPSPDGGTQIRISTSDRLQ